VPPGEDRQVSAENLVGDPWTIPFDLEFTDAAGRTWCRKSDGRLTEQGRTCCAGPRTGPLLTWRSGKSGLVAIRIRRGMPYLIAQFSSGSTAGSVGRPDQL
jgi:hypothetical protein